MRGAGGYSQRITHALDQDDPAGSVTDVKAAVIAELRALDPAISLTTTQYFNHSFAPDLVASWPQDPSIPDRFIYLKINSQLDYLLDDVGLVADQRPIVFNLSPTPGGSDELSREIVESTRRTNTLVTDADGVEELIEHNSSRFVSLASNAVTQGGRGVVDQDNGAAAAATLEAGFAGALAIEPTPTLDARETLDTLLDKKYAERMTRLLQAAWVGAGGQLEDFPGRATDLTTGIADEALQFLLEYDEIDDRGFWYRLGRQVPIAQLGRLVLPEGSVNLEHFIGANMHALSARACRVTEQSQLDTRDRPAGSVLRWFTERDRRLLALSGSSFTVFFGTNVSDLASVKRKRESGIRITELADRAEHAVITEAEVFSLSGKGKRTVTIRSEDHTDLIPDLAARETFPELGEDGAGAIVLVKRASAALKPTPGGRERVLSCDFRTATASRRTSGLLSLAELVNVGVPLLHNTTAADHAALTGMAPSEDDGTMMFDYLGMDEDADEDLS